MDAARVLRQARRRAGLTQRALAGRAGVPQSQIAKIESGRVIPRVDTLDRLLDACGEGLESLARPGIGVDRTMYPELLALSPRDRLRTAAVDAARFARRLAHARR
ncbi:MAG: helix-turn-helix domain-containing protein [Actinomycetota bacterium]|nr:helix-turn-helix domain-containing protein [Actinomycetota bacterium]